MATLQAAKAYFAGLNARSVPRVPLAPDVVLTTPMLRGRSPPLSSEHAASLHRRED
jgi:hypothetical protein